MGKLIVVQGDKVQGTDKHNVAGNATNPSAPPPTVPYKGVGDFEYDGTMVNGLCTFVKIGGRPVAVVSSQSMLDANGQINHTGPKGSNFQPPSPPPIAATLTITDPIGVGYAKRHCRQHVRVPRWGQGAARRRQDRYVRRHESNDELDRHGEWPELRVVRGLSTGGDMVATGFGFPFAVTPGARSPTTQMRTWTCAARSSRSSLRRQGSG